MSKQARGKGINEGVSEGSTSPPQAQTAHLQPSLITAATNSSIVATDGSTQLQSTTTHAHDATYEYISDSELPIAMHNIGENRAYNVRDGEMQIRTGENAAYRHNHNQIMHMPAEINLQRNEAYNYREPVPTPNIAYNGGQTAEQLAEDVYEYVK